MNEQFADHINWLGYNFKAYLRESLASYWNWSKVFTRCAVSFKFRLFHVKCRLTSFDLSSWSPQQILCSVQQTRSWLYHLLLVQWLTLWEEISKLHQRQPISLTESCGYRNEQQKVQLATARIYCNCFWLRSITITTASNWKLIGGRQFYWSDKLDRWWYSAMFVKLC